MRQGASGGWGPVEGSADASLPHPPPSRQQEALQTVSETWKLILPLLSVRAATPPGLSRDSLVPLMRHLEQLAVWCMGHVSTTVRDEGVRMLNAIYDGTDWQARLPLEPVYARVGDTVTVRASFSTRLPPGARFYLQVNAPCQVPRVEVGGSLRAIDIGRDLRRVAWDMAEGREDAPLRSAAWADSFMTLHAPHKISQVRCTGRCAPTPPCAGADLTRWLRPDAAGGGRLGQRHPCGAGVYVPAFASAGLLRLARRRLRSGGYGARLRPLRPGVEPASRGQQLPAPGGGCGVRDTAAGARRHGAAPCPPVPGGRGPAVATGELLDAGPSLGPAAPRARDRWAHHRGARHRRRQLLPA